MNDDIKEMRIEALNTNLPSRRGKMVPGPGRPKGMPNFKTVFRKALEKIAAKDQLDDGDKVLVDVVMKGIERAAKGDFRFYQDTLDRALGPVQKEVPTQGVHLTQINVLDPERAEHIRRIANIHDDKEGSH